MCCFHLYIYKHTFTYMHSYIDTYIHSWQNNVGSKGFVQDSPEVWVSVFVCIRACMCMQILWLCKCVCMTTHAYTWKSKRMLQTVCAHVCMFPTCVYVQTVGGDIHVGIHGIAFCTCCGCLHAFILLHMYLQCLYPQGTFPEIYGFVDTYTDMHTYTFNKAGAAVESSFTAFEYLYIHTYTTDGAMGVHLGVIYRLRLLYHYNIVSLHMHARTLVLLYHNTMVDCTYMLRHVPQHTPSHNLHMQMFWVIYVCFVFRFVKAYTNTYTQVYAQICRWLPVSLDTYHACIHT